MAGRRHHYLPRFLQKGFSSRQTGKDIYTWVFKKDTQPYQTNLLNVGAEKDFYGTPEESSLDDNISDKELFFSPLLDELRAYTSNARINNKQVSRFVIHLITRTRHLRLSMEEMGNAFFDMFGKYLSSSDKLRNLILQYTRENPNELRNTIKKSLVENGMGNLHPAMLELASEAALNQAPQLLRSPAFIAMWLGLEHGFRLLEKDLPKIVKKSHLRALSKDIVPPKQLSKIRNLQWKLCVEGPGTLILGDMGPLATKKSSGDIKSLFLLDGDEIDQIFLPISSSHLVLGSKSDTMHPYEVEPINVASASSSREFFIAGQVTSDFLSFRNLIGTKSALYSEEELREMERDLMSELLRSSSH